VQFWGETEEEYMRHDWSKVYFTGSTNRTIVSKCVVGGRPVRTLYLHKPDGRRLLAEALAAQIETILADETRLMCTEAADNTTKGMR
jgi:hypothetical protein